MAQIKIEFTGGEPTDFRNYKFYQKVEVWKSERVGKTAMVDDCLVEEWQEIEVIGKRENLIEIEQAFKMQVSKRFLKAEAKIAELEGKLEALTKKLEEKFKGL